MVGNAVIDIWAKEVVMPICKYKDDLKVFHFPVENRPFYENNYSYLYDHNECICRIQDLHVPWHPDKGNLQFLFVTDYIGFCWDIPQCQVSLPLPKCLKFLEHVRVFLDKFSGHHCHLNGIESIHSSLCHVAFVYLDGHSHLPSLSNFTALFKGNEYIMHYAPPLVISNLQFWHNGLKCDDVSHKLIPHGEIQDLGIYVDASMSWG